MKQLLVKTNHLLDYLKQVLVMGKQHRIKLNHQPQPNRNT